MANHKSALKRNRQSLVRKARNGINKTKVSTAFKKVRAAIASSPQDAPELLKKAASTIAKAASKGTLHKRTAARRISRLSRQVHVATRDLAETAAAPEAAEAPSES
ncbi:MAG: 30S ribosomal protein S20 [Deltaproteobacteria bacterium]|nr:30S ribosomal protein S20 [Deltaproteobacteria bacterium]